MMGVAGTPTNITVVSASGACLDLIRQLDRIGIDVTSETNGYKVSSTQRLTLLDQLTELYQKSGHGLKGSSYLDADPDDIRTAALAKRESLVALGAIPVWDGEKWIDARWTATLGNTLLPDAAKGLARLNYLDRGYIRWVSSAPGRASMGEVDSEFSAIKKELATMGIGIVLDPQLKIWRADGGK